MRITDRSLTVGVRQGVGEGTGEADGMAYCWLVDGGMGGFFQNLISFSDPKS